MIDRVRGRMRSVPVAATTVSASTPAAESTPTAATSTIAASATTTAATSAAFFAGTGFIDGEGATAMLLAVEGGNCRLGFLIGAHFDKSEPFAAAGVAVVDDLGGYHLPMRGKQLFEF